MSRIYNRKNIMVIVSVWPKPKEWTVWLSAFGNRIDVHTHSRVSARDAVRKAVVEARAIRNDICEALHD